MCGISGFAGNYSAGLIQKMNNMIVHRGPDGVGVYENQAAQIGLGHVRLAVLDLSHSADQPMVAGNDQHVLIYNGEIYNYLELKKDLEKRGYSFRTTGDTEVLLNGLMEYGDGFVSRLNGIFAFAYWNEQQQELLLARDHLGVKPLYYTEPGTGRLIFSSEIKAFYVCPDFVPLPDFVSLQQHLTYSHSAGDRTALLGVKRLKPGQLLKWKAGKKRVTPFWATSYSRSTSIGFDESVQQLRTHLETAIRRQLVSDVPVGVFLSGGLDSSLITALAARELGQDLRCYTSGFSIGENNIDQMDPDLPHARELAKILGLRLQEVALNPNLTDLLPRLIYHLDEPIADPAILPSYLISQQAREDGTKVLLSGQGADELYCGYPRYRAMQISGYLDELPKSIRELISSLATRIPGAKGGSSGALLRRIRKVLASAGAEPLERFLNYCTNTPQSEVSAVLNPSVTSELSGELYNQDCLEYMTSKALDDFNRFRDRDLTTYLPNHNLLYTDKMSMAMGVEARVPLLDIELVRFASKLPEDYLVNARSDKLALRSAATGIVPEQIINRKKTGFGAPFRKWLRDDLSELWMDITSKHSLSHRGWFDCEALKNIRERSLKGRDDLYMLQWSVITTELWARQFIDSSEISRVAGK